MSSTKWNTAEQWGKDHVLISSTETTEFALRSKSQALGSGFILHLQSRLFFSRSVMSDSLQPHWLQHARLPCPSPTPRACSNTCRSVESVIPSNHLILCCLLLLSWIFPCIRVFSNESILQSGGQNIGASASSSALPKNIQDFSFRIDWVDLLVVQRTLKGSSPAPQFESISSLVLNLLYGPILTSIHDYWKNHSFDYMGLCQQSDVSAFWYAV